MSRCVFTIMMRAGGLRLTVLKASFFLLVLVRWTSIILTWLCASLGTEINRMTVSCAKTPIVFIQPSVGLLVSESCAIQLIENKILSVIRQLKKLWDKAANTWREIFRQSSRENLRQMIQLTISCTKKKSSTVLDMETLLKESHIIHI